ncbi:hypothetical protein BDB01DRAFT_722449 [Pilobolus umbonatus]|nr:hypothetical protein BDB01DRAFT_722449 [Pilobolus umbonatus]
MIPCPISECSQTSPTLKSEQSKYSNTMDDAKKKKSKKQYPCPYCNKNFTRPSALKTHEYTHTEEKPFECDQPGCNKRFSVVSNLRRHFKVHRQPSINNRMSSEDRKRRVKDLMALSDALQTGISTKPLTIKKLVSLTMQPTVYHTPANHPTSFIPHSTHYTPNEHHYYEQIVPEVSPTYRYQYSDTNLFKHSYDSPSFTNPMSSDLIPNSPIPSNPISPHNNAWSSNIIHSNTSQQLLNHSLSYMSNYIFSPPQSPLDHACL